MDQRTQRVVQPLQWWKRDRSLGGLGCHAKERAHLEPHVSFRVIVTLQAACEILFMASPSGWRPNMKTRQTLLTVWASNQSAKYGFPYVLIQHSSQRRTDSSKWASQHVASQFGQKPSFDCQTSLRVFYVAWASDWKQWGPGSILNILVELDYWHFWFNCNGL